MSRPIFKTLLVIFFGITTVSCKNEHKSVSEIVVTDQDSENEVLIEDLEGNAIDLDEFKGKVVILNFWATWCKPCISEMPSLDRLAKKSGVEELVILAASDENIDKIGRFAERNPHDFTYVHLKSNVYSLGLSVLPTTYIINRKGEIVEKIVGAREWDSEESYEMIKSI